MQNAKSSPKSKPWIELTTSEWLLSRALKLDFKARALNIVDNYSWQSILKIIWPFLCHDDGSRLLTKWMFKLGVFDESINHPIIADDLQFVANVGYWLSIIKDKRFVYLFDYSPRIPGGVEVQIISCHPDTFHLEREDNDWVFYFTDGVEFFVNWYPYPPDAPTKLGYANTSEGLWLDGSLIAPAESTWLDAMTIYQITPYYFWDITWKVVYLDWYKEPRCFYPVDGCSSANLRYIPWAIQWYDHPSHPWHLWLHTDWSADYVCHNKVKYSLNDKNILTLEVLTIHHGPIKQEVAINDVSRLIQSWIIDLDVALRDSRVQMYKENLIWRIQHISSELEVFGYKFKTK